MAKKPPKKEEEVDSLSEQVAPVSSPRPAVSPFFEKMLLANQKRFGKEGSYVATDNSIIGLEPYSLALQYLMHLQVVPLQSIIIVAGEPKTYKTSALLEFCRMGIQNPGFPEHPGLGAIINTEGKWSDSKAQSMLREDASKLVIHRVTSVEEWQATATHYLTNMRDVINKKKEAIASRAKNSEYKDLVIPPMIIGIDSLTGSQTENVQEKLIKEGHGAKTFQDRAMLNWQWFGTWGSNLIGMPATVVVAQHLKDQINSTSGIQMKITSGGTADSYACSMQIRVQNAGAIDRAGYDGCYLKWRMHFNSLGQDKRSIKIPYIETYDDQDRQLAYFDWDEALILCLMERMEESEFKPRISEVIGSIQEYSKPGLGKVYSCERLGITKQDAMENGITAKVLGKTLQDKNQPYRAELQKALRIQSAQVWKPESF